MKKIAVLFVTIIIACSGCKKDFDPKFYGTLSPSTFPSNASEYELYTMELYVPFYSRWGYGGAFAWENNFFSPEWGHLIMFDGSTDIMPVFINWGGFWQGFTSTDFRFMKTQGRGSHFEKVRFVTRATKIIDDLQKTKVLTPAQKNALVAEARMARGWTMYYLLHIFGPVPVILDPAKIGTDAEANLTRPTRVDYVAAVEADLRYASDNLPKSPANYGRFNKGAALTVLMRLYLNEKNFSKAESVGREILPLGYDLVSDYSSLFKEATEKNVETIWAVSCQNASASGNFNPWPFYCYPSDYVGNKIPTGWGGSTGVLSATWSFYDSFDPADKRRQLLIAQYTANDGTTIKNRTNMNGAVIAKYQDAGGALNSVQGNDLVVCRYADVLLMLAESINENAGPTAEAVALVNRVRSRAGISAISPAQQASKDAFRDMLFMERGHELYFEGLRKMDLIRMNKVQSALTGAGKTVGPNYNVFPLPDYAFSNSGGQLKQIDGY
ncbi:MAG: RagB/SusD family nutrient uptake outer membrane protein [Chitinophagaceae bacterium]